MKDLNNIAVFIKDEDMLEEAREMLERNGEEVGYFFELSDNISKNYLLKSRKWYIDGIDDDDTEITLTELETLLKERSDE